MKRKKKLSEKKGISNASLLGASAVVLALGAIWFYWALFALPGQRGWKDFEYQLLGKTLTDQSGPQPASGYLKYISLPVLMYHHVGPLPAKADRLRRDMTVTAENFELQVAWLKGQGYESIVLNDLLQYKQGKFRLPQKPVIFTFDDGYKDVFDYAVPILKKYGFTGSFGIITQFPGITQGTNEYASWEQIIRAKKDGMEIISHTQDHFDGTNTSYNADFILRNLADSKKDLQNNLGSALPILIYPFGHYDREYLDAARQAGFEIGLTVNPGQRINMDNLMEMPRVRVNANYDLERFKRIVQAGD